MRSQLVVVMKGSKMFEKHMYRDTCAYIYTTSFPDRRVFHSERIVIVKVRGMSQHSGF
jgi:hypothetical protein